MMKQKFGVVNERETKKNIGRLKTIEKDGACLLNNWYAVHNLRREDRSDCQPSIFGAAQQRPFGMV